MNSYDIDECFGILGGMFDKELDLNRESLSQLCIQVPRFPSLRPFINALEEQLVELKAIMESSEALCKRHADWREAALRTVKSTREELSTKLQDLEQGAPTSAEAEQVQ